MNLGNETIEQSVGSADTSHSNFPTSSRNLSPTATVEACNTRYSHGNPPLPNNRSYILTAKCSQNPTQRLYHGVQIRTKIEFLQLLPVLFKLLWKFGDAKS